MQRLIHFKMGEGASIVEHINEFNMVISQLSSIVINFDNDVHALIVFLIAW